MGCLGWIRVNIICKAPRDIQCKRILLRGLGVRDSCCTVRSACVSCRYVLGLTFQGRTYLFCFFASAQNAIQCLISGHCRLSASCLLQIPEHRILLSASAVSLKMLVKVGLLKTKVLRIRKMLCGDKNCQKSTFLSH